MLKEDFYNAIAPPLNGLKDFRDPLQQLSREYPWFSAAHIYLTKADHLLGHVDYNEHLKLAAVHSFDREGLWKFIMKEKLQKQVAEIDQQITEEIAVESLEAQAKEGEKEAVVEVPSEEVVESKEEIVTVPIEAEEPAASGQEEITEGDDPEEEGKRIVHADEFDDMQREILLEAISSTIELESVESEEESEGNGEVASQIDSVSEPEKDTTQTASLSPFASFLLKKAEESHWQEEHRAAKYRSAEEQTGPIPPTFDDGLPPEEKQRSLIDQFIDKDPKITPGKAELFSTENLAKMSVVEDQSFVTETMAQIYAKQGAWKKAMKAYEMLSLKFPEKSVYFANQIKKLQESRKSKK